MKRVALILLLITCSAASLDGCSKKSGGVSAEELSGRPAELPDDIWRQLYDAGWKERVSERLGLWVSVANQELIGLRGGEVQFRYPCSTAFRGTGFRENSFQTPLGWHAIEERIGDGLPLGAVLIERKFTGDVWKPGMKTEKDLVLTRILWLRGLEPGVNQGPGIDSHARYIYIHGTPAEAKLGKPASMGCIRLSNVNMVKVFEGTEKGTTVLITSW